MINEDIVSLRVKTGQIPVSSAVVKYHLTVAVVQCGLTRHDYNHKCE